MIVVKLREAMERYRRIHGQRITYHEIAEKTELSRATLEAIASRPNYLPTLATIERICIALQCTPGELLEIVPDNPQKRGRQKEVDS